MISYHKCLVSLLLVFVLNTVVIEACAPCKKILEDKSYEGVAEHHYICPLGDHCVNYPQSNGACWKKFKTYVLMSGFPWNLASIKTCNDDGIAETKQCYGSKCFYYYKVPGVNYYCQPTCEKRCKNNQCVGHDPCNCGSGFKRDGEGFCVPDCTKVCPNGKCVGENKCECNSGYQLDHTETCKPVCPNGCSNAVCVAPGRCSCFEGFVPSGASGCVASCPVGCAPNGYCPSPGNCVCNDGYQVTTHGTCQKTIKCQNGTPVNGKCVCPADHTFDGIGTCKADGYDFDPRMDTRRQEKKKEPVYVGNDDFGFQLD